MSARFKERLDCEVVLVRSGGGIFDIEVDGECVFSKYENGHFPDEHWLLEKINKLDT